MTTLMISLLTDIAQNDFVWWSRFSVVAHAANYIVLLVELIQRELQMDVLVLDPDLGSILKAYKTPLVGFVTFDDGRRVIESIFPFGQ